VVRIVTAMFVHVASPPCTNMWCLWNLGLLAEPLIGSLVFSGLHLTGAAGNLLSTFANWISYRRIGHPHDLGVSRSSRRSVRSLASRRIDWLLKSNLLPFRQRAQKLRGP